MKSVIWTECGPPNKLIIDEVDCNQQTEFPLIAVFYI